MFSEARASIADSAAETSSAAAVSGEGVSPKATGTTKGPADCRTSFVSAPIRQVRTPMANVTTAGQAETAPASAYKTPMLVGNRSRLSYPLAAAAVSKTRLKMKISIATGSPTPTCIKTSIWSAAYLGNEHVGRFAFQWDESRAPKIAEPTRTYVAPSCTASGQSALMPMERSVSPLRSAITPSSAKCGETCSFAGGIEQVSPHFALLGVI